MEKISVTKSTAAFRGFSIALFLLVTLFQMSKAHAYGQSYSSGGAGMSAKDYEGFFGGGILDHEEGATATNAATGSKPFFGEVYTQLSFMGAIKVADRWAFSPLLVYGFPSKKDPGGFEKTIADSFVIRADYSIGSGFDAHIGPGVLYYQIKGSGGTTTLSNGNGTSSFGLPSGTKTSTLLAWDLGAGYQYDIYRFDLSLLITGIMSSTKRAISPVLSLSVEVF